MNNACHDRWNFFRYNFIVTSGTAVSKRRCRCFGSFLVNAESRFFPFSCCGRRSYNELLFVCIGIVVTRCAPSQLCFPLDRIQFPGSFLLSAQPIYHLLKWIKVSVVQSEFSLHPPSVLLVTGCDHRGLCSPCWVFRIGLLIGKLETSVLLLAVLLEKKFHFFLRLTIIWFHLKRR